MSLKKLWLIALLALPLGCQPPADTPPADSGDSNSTAAADSDETTTQLVFAVDGMSCSVACPPHVKKTLESVPGVASAEVDFDTKQAKVDVVSGQFDETLAVKALSDAGFQGHVTSSTM